MNDFLNMEKIFCPTRIENAQNFMKDGSKFAYYTNASTAVEIIRNQEIWLRNALIMNDYSEISYGLKLFRNGLESQAGQEFGKALNSIELNLFDKTMEWFETLEETILTDTFITCLSSHFPSENQHGRLSMWRAYGNTALVVNHSPFLNENAYSGIYSVPVHYWNQTDFDSELSKVARLIDENNCYLKNAEKSSIQRGIYSLLLSTAIGTKHPGFAEEMELRIFTIPTFSATCDKIVKRIVTIHDVPQEVVILPLIRDSDYGVQLDLPNILDNIIVGPTPYPFSMQKAFVQVLEKVGVGSAWDRVSVSEIPLRTIT